MAKKGETKETRREGREDREDPNTMTEGEVEQLLERESKLAEREAELQDRGSGVAAPAPGVTPSTEVDKKD